MIPQSWCWTVIISEFIKTTWTFSKLTETKEFSYWNAEKSDQISVYDYYFLKYFYLAFGSFKEWVGWNLQFHYSVIFMQIVVFRLNYRSSASILHIFTWNKEAHLDSIHPWTWSNFLVESICENNWLKGFISDCINRA